MHRSNILSYLFGDDMVLKTAIIRHIRRVSVDSGRQGVGYCRHRSGTKSFAFPDIGITVVVVARRDNHRLALSWLYVLNIKCIL
jgi:hypothetical protein